MKALIIAFSGLIATGKSELSRSVAAALRWERVSFGDYIRSMARQRNMDPIRRNLQTLGEAIILEQGWDSYCHSVLKQIGWTPGQPVVLDGLRHSEALDSLKRIASPMEVVLVLLESPDDVRQSRLSARDACTHDELEQLDTHSTEVQVSGILRTLADLILDSNKPITELTSTVIDWLRERQKRGMFY